MSAPAWVEYDGMQCPTCSAPLYLEDEGSTVCIRCMDCGPLESVLLTACGGATRPGCGARLFFGGAMKKAPINITTGRNHFYDCPKAGNFRKKPAEKAAAKKPEAPPQRSMF